jgi:hypothetical protein
MKFVLIQEKLTVEKKVKLNYQDLSDFLFQAHFNKTIVRPFLSVGIQLPVSL